MPGFERPLVRSVSSKANATSRSTRTAELSPAYAATENWILAGRLHHKTSFVRANSSKPSR